MTGAVVFEGYSHLQGETRVQSADHLRLWLTAYFTDWTMLGYRGYTTKLFFWAKMWGMYEMVVLRCAVGRKFEPSGFRYALDAGRIINH